MFVFDSLRRYSNFQTNIEYINYLKYLSLQFVGHATLTRIARACTRRNRIIRREIESDRTWAKIDWNFHWKADEIRHRHASPRTNGIFISTSDASRYSSGRARPASRRLSEITIAIYVLGDRNPLRELIILRLEAPLQPYIHVFRATYFRIMQVARLNSLDMKFTW